MAAAIPTPPPAAGQLSGAGGVVYLRSWLALTLGRDALACCAAEHSSPAALPFMNLHNVFWSVYAVFSPAIVRSQWLARGCVEL